MEFREMELGELCNIVTDYVANGSFKSLSDNVKYSNTGYAQVIRLVDYNNNYTLKDSIWVSKEGYEYLKKSKLYGGEIIITNVGANLGTVFIAPYLKHPMTLGPNAVMLKSNENDLYLYYWLISPEGRNKIKAIVTGSAMPKFNKTDLKKIKILIPSLDAQKKIVKILFDIDKKIELNNQINDNLLNLIDIYYDEIFTNIVCKKRADEIANITIGKTPPRIKKECFTKNNSDIKWLSISDIGKCGVYVFNTYEKLTQDAIDTYNVKVIPENTIVLSFKLTVGRVAITNEKMATNEAIAHFNLYDEKIKSYIYTYLRKFDYNKLGSTSSIATAVNSKIIKTMPIEIPSEKDLEKFNELADGLLKMIRLNEKENIKLEQLRDILLPKLMNGEIDLDKIEI